MSKAIIIFNQLLNTKRSLSKSLQIFENRYFAQVTKFNAISEITKLPEFIMTLLILAKDGIADIQRVTFLATAAPNDTNLDSTSSNGDFHMSRCFIDCSAI